MSGGRGYGLRGAEGCGDFPRWWTRPRRALSPQKRPRGWGGVVVVRGPRPRCGSAGGSPARPVPHRLPRGVSSFSACPAVVGGTADGPPACGAGKSGFEPV